MDPGMNQLLKWSIENSDVTRNDPTASTDPKAERPSGQGLNAEAIKALMGGPSDAELMKQSMAAIESPDVSLDQKLVAFDNLEQLIETVDNANNMQPLGLWTPLKDQLTSHEADMRRMAAWCMGTAVQNNQQSQERLLVVGAIPILVKLALQDSDSQVRRKAVYAISSEVRNYSPALNVVAQELPEDLRPSRSLDAGDMEEVDTLIDAIKEASSRNMS
ncbi:MAG: hypothetical protein LQ341_004532 [Variospora aurantia]|nr:MAG: hypothetical protein LQ341_004532 [Variospora aurantia]